MELVIPSFPASPRDWWTRKRLLWALAASVALHLGLLIWGPAFREKAPQPPAVLQVELAPPPKEEPPPKVELPPEPAPKPRVVPPPRRAVEAQPPKPTPAPLPPPEPVMATNPDIPRPPESVPFTVPATPPAPRPPAPVVEMPRVAEPPPPPPPPAPSAPDPRALEGYGRSLSAAIGREQRYPRIAQMRGWEGTVQVVLRFAASGSVEGVKLAGSSGHEILDQQALEMVERARPLPQAPAALAGRAFEITVPIVFRLQR